MGQRVTSAPTILPASTHALPVGVPMVLPAGAYPIAPGFELRTADIALQPGRVHALVGPNGAGKTSLLKLLAGAQPNVSADVHFATSPPMALTSFEQAHLVGVVTHAPGPWSLPLIERLCLDAALVGASAQAAEMLAEQWIAHLALESIAHKTWKAMSAGFRMRAAIARQMVQGPPVLLLDEPLGPLDLATQRRVLGDLRAIASRPPHGVAVVLSSQHLAEVETVADELIIVENGVVTYAGQRDAFGANFGTTVFELAGLDAAAIVACLESIGGVIRRADASGVRAEFHAEMTSIQLMAALVQRQVAVTSLRELTNSSARLL